MASMSQDQAIRKWLNGGQKSLRAAQTLHKDHNDELALFHCHLSAEKILKALYIFEHDSSAPRTHDLAMLVSELKNEKIKEWFEEFKAMSKFSIAARYDDLEILEGELDPSRVEHWIAFCNSLLNHAHDQTQ